MSIARRKTRQIHVGSVAIGGGAPVSVQSMTTTPTEDVRRTVAQIRRLEQLGCDIVRVAVPTRAAAEALGRIKSRINIPLVADIHFDYLLAIASIEQGADCVRINPGNIGDRRRVRKVVEAAKAHGIPLRVGVNSGSILPRKGLRVRRQPRDMAALMVRKVLEHCRHIESLGFGDLKLSLKASDVPTTLAAYRAVAAQCDYPLHVGVTAAGLKGGATIKSAVGIGALLSEGIGDTIRVSLTGPPYDEVRMGQQILSTLGLRRPHGPEIISCPTCGRCRIDLAKLVGRVRREVASVEADLKIAVMGCVVNGPGEAEEADVGIAGGKGFGFIFRTGAEPRRVSESRLVPELMKEIEALTQRPKRKRKGN